MTLLGMVMSLRNVLSRHQPVGIRKHGLYSKRAKRSNRTTQMRSRSRRHYANHTSEPDVTKQKNTRGKSGESDVARQWRLRHAIAGRLTRKCFKNQCG